MCLPASFRALNRYTCCRVLEVLRRGPRSVGDIRAQIKGRGSRASISQALKLLVEADMVSCERRGRQNIYQLRPAPFQELIVYARGLYRDARGRSLNR